MEKNYRFKVPSYRVFNKETKQMVYSGDGQHVFMFSRSGFSVAKLGEEGVIEDIIAEETNSVPMQSAGWRDSNNTDVYEGDVVFCRKLMAGKQFLPVCGIVNAKDFTFSINSGVKHFLIDYSDKDLVVLGNIFQNSDEELAAKAEKLFAKYPVK